MAYFLVMGGLALAVCFTFGWAVWRMLRWVFARLGRRAPSTGKKTASRASKGRKTSPRAPAKGAARAASKEKAPSPRANAAAEKGAARRDKAEPSPPWRLTVALASLRGAWPLAVLLGALYGGGRLVAHGMVARPQHAPDAFRQLVEAVGWGAAGLLGVAVLGWLATWRCRRQ
ncbi:hypothetical protein [Halomonas getboli]|uniref:hypothetical protein n=1 Tax=Halomonas getboli TaxID=2935862 RepID=UPI001FFF7D5B|nr:hypothetical protein [Halomonas getboli]MCK2183318.1 hypothetical protein [Halomonas getboli]